MIHILINNRIMSIAIAAAMAASFSSPAMANEKKDSIPTVSKYKERYSTHQLNLTTDKANNGNSPYEISGRKINRRAIHVDFSWYKPEPPLDINPYDKIQLDFSWHNPAEPLDINPYTDKI